MITLHDPQTLEFVMTRSIINSFDEVVQGYRQYMLHLQRARATGQKLHVILNLRAVKSLDSKFWSYVSQMRELMKNVPEPETPTVTRLSVKLESATLRVVLRQIFPFLVGKQVLVDIGS